MQLENGGVGTPVEQLTNGNTSHGVQGRSQQQVAVEDELAGRAADGVDIFCQRRVGEQAHDGCSMGTAGVHEHGPATARYTSPWWLTTVLVVSRVGLRVSPRVLDKPGVTSSMPVGDR